MLIYVEHLWSSHTTKGWWNMLWIGFEGCRKHLEWLMNHRRRGDCVAQVDSPNALWVTWTGLLLRHLRKRSARVAVSKVRILHAELIENTWIYMLISTQQCNGSKSKWFWVISARSSPDFSHSWTKAINCLSMSGKTIATFDASAWKTSERLLRTVTFFLERISSVDASSFASDLYLFGNRDANFAKAQRVSERIAAETFLLEPQPCTTGPDNILIFFERS